MLGLGISLASIGGTPTKSIVSSGKGARALIDLTISRASDTSTSEGYDCMVAAISEMGLDTLYDFADAVIENMTDRITTTYYVDSVDCLKSSIVELSR
jgi:hypothetical protein